MPSGKLQSVLAWIGNMFVTDAYYFVYCTMHILVISIRSSLNNVLRDILLPPFSCLSQNVSISLYYDGRDVIFETINPFDSACWLDFKLRRRRDTARGHAGARSRQYRRVWSADPEDASDGTHESGHHGAIQRNATTRSVCAVRISANIQYCFPLCFLTAPSPLSSHTDLSIS